MFGGMAWFPRGDGSLMTRSTPYWVLVVEDDPTDALLITAVFSHGDETAHVQVARSAEEAIAHLTGPWGDADFGHNVLPDIIVLDILMEGVGGLGFLAWFRGGHKIDLPIVVFTSSQDPDLKRQCLALGAAEFKVKPTDFSELVDVVHRVLDRWEPGRAKAPAS